MLIHTRAEFEYMIRAVRDSDIVVFDTEATGLYLRHEHRTIGISIYIPTTSESFYFAWGHGTKDMDCDYESIKRWSNAKKRAYAYSVYRDSLLPGILKENLPVEWLNDLKAVWNPDKLYIAHNAQFDLTALCLLGFPTPTRIADTMSMLSVVNSDWKGNAREGYFPVFTMPDGTQEKGSRGLKWQARLWGLSDAEAGIDELTTAVLQLEQDLRVLGGDRATLGITTDFKAQEYLWMLPASKVSLYAEDDVRLTYGLYEKILRYSDSWGDRHIHDLYNRITLSVWQMQNQGFRFNGALAQEVIDQGDKEIAELEDRIKILTHGLIHNPNSPAQVTAYLRAAGYNVTGSSKAVLKKIEDDPALRLIEDLRHINKLLGTYVKAWNDNAVLGYVHPELNVGGAGTGRLSSSSDMFGNFQNVPRTSTKGNINPKMLLYPPEGNIIIDLDYQALEGRLGAWVAETIIGRGRSLVLTDLIERGVDMHSYTMEVSGIYSMLLNGRTEAQYLLENGYQLSDNDDPVKYFREKIARYKAKTTNFAAQYGAGVRGIQKAVDCSAQEAEVLLEGYHRAYPAIRPAMDKLARLAMTPTPLPTNTGANRIRSAVLNGLPYDSLEGEAAQYLIYLLPEVNLRRKYSWYPVSQTNEKGQTYSPLQKASRGAFNSVVQGTGGLLVLNSILRATDKFGLATFENTDAGRVYDYSTGLIVSHLTVHDSFALSLRPKDLCIVPEIVRLMCDYPVRPKLEVDISAAPINGSWGEVEKVKDVEKWIASEGVEGF